MPNYTPATATAITSLPFTEATTPVGSSTPSVLVPTCGDPDYPLWWVYTPPTGVNGIGIQVASTFSAFQYQPAVSIWTGTLPSLTQLDNCCYLFNDPTRARIGVTPGTAYYILVAKDAGSGPVSGTVTITVQGLNDATATGSLLITSDIGNQATIVINDTNGTSIRALGMAASEMGDFLETGELAIMAEDPADANTAVGIQLWSRGLGTLDTTVTSIIRANQLSVSPIRSNRNGTWYVASVLSAAATIVKTLNSAGTVGGTSWTLPANSANMHSMGVNQGGTILYYANETDAEPIYAYNLAVPGALANFVAGAANVRYQRDIWVTAAGHVFAVQKDDTAGTVYRVRQWNAAGVVQFSYTITGNLSNNPRMGMSADETYFVVMSFPANDVSRFHFFDVGNTTATLTFDVDQNDSTGDGPLFGPSQSCPLLLLPLSVSPPPGEGTTRYIRRVREFLFPSSDSNNAMFIPGVEFLIQPGVGDGEDDSQGEDPQLMFQVSKDGGKTFGAEQWASMGQQGAYTTRVKFTRTPNRYRNAVGRVVVTDPVDASLVDCVAKTITEGTS